jgi:type IV pilus assembly protein PilY1
MKAEFKKININLKRGWDMMRPNLLTTHIRWFNRRNNGTMTKLPVRTARRSIGRFTYVLITALLVLGIASAAHAGYSYRKEITIHNEKVSGSTNLSNFPVLIDIGADPDLKGRSSGGHVEHTDGYDIIFKDASNNQIAHEIEQYSTATGRLLAWVKVPILDYNTDTIIYIHYGNDAISAPTENPAGVWDSNYGGVWHMEENPSGAAPQIKDSTANDNHGTAKTDSWNPWTSSDHVQGKIGYASYFHDHGGSDKHIDVGNDTSVDCTTGITMQAWIKPDSIELVNRPVLYKSGAYKIDSMRGYNNTPDGYVYIDGEGWLSEHPPDPLTTDWHHLASTWDSSDGVLRLYVDGVEVDTDDTSKSDPRIRVTTDVLKIAKKDAEAVIDEARLSCSARSAGWLATEYNSQSSPGTFYSIGAEEGTASEYTITASSGDNGSISPAGDVVVPSGDDQLFLFDPDAGYEVLNVMVDGSSIGSPSSYNFTDVSNNHTITVSFGAIGSYTISTSAGSNGSISPAGPVSVAPGGSASFVIIPDPAYAVDDVQINGSSIGAVTTYTFTAVSSDQTIAAQFILVGEPPEAGNCLNVSDIPLDARYKSAVPNIMILLDDSGSMDWAIMTSGNQGRYLDHYEYVFDNPGGADFSCEGCQHYDRDSILTRGDRRLHWKTQWSEFNKLYYNPAIDYAPWPDGTTVLGAADVDNPRAHPLHATPTFNLSTSFDNVAVSVGEVIADNEDTAIFTKTGPWTGVTHGEALYNHYWVSYTDDQDFTATWSPYLMGGEYEVFAHWRAMPYRDTQTPYLISHAGGDTLVKVNQRINGGTWVSLGTFTFNTGTTTVKTWADEVEIDENTVCADALKFVPTGAITLDIPRAHYYTYSASEGNPYLVIVDDGSIDYYKFDDGDGDDVVDPGELTQTLHPPADVETVRDYFDERQNFANWYSYYRKRGNTATVATAQLIYAMQGVRIGIYGLNGVDTGRSPASIVQPVLNVKANGEDKTDILLDKLYSFYWSDSTPLRRALENVGRYFDKGDTLKIDGSAGDDSPWDTAENGGECQQAFTIMLTDGYWNGSAPLTAAIGNVDIDNGDPYADDWSDTVADVAMYYYERDLAPGLTDSVPINFHDDARHQHLVTYSVGFGLVGINDPDDYDINLKHKVTGLFIDWPDPGAAQAGKLDDQWHAAVNARGRFINASNPTELIDSLREIMMDIELRIFSAAGVSINGDKLYEKLHPDILMFQTSYFSDGWTGDVKAYEVDPVTGVVNTSAYEWAAAPLLASKKEHQRIIATFNGAFGIPFEFGKLNDLQKGQLDPDWETSDERAKDLVKFLRGDQAEEMQNGGTFRTRFSVLGDIVHSSPVFKNNVIYTGANDGMLHAFNADTGKELFAYVPNLVFGNLEALSNPGYVHQYFVDLTPVVSDIDYAGMTTMLVGGLGKGGRGYFALDVSGIDPLLSADPSTEKKLADRVLWEYPDLDTHPDEVADVGYSFSRPSVVQSNDPAHPWLVIFGNGYSSAHENAVLFILDPASGDLIRRINTQVGSCNGLSSPVAVDVDSDYKVDYVYAGDLKGNLWKFDLTSDNAADWSVAFEDGGTPKPLFQEPGQPITAKPNVMFHCEKPGYMVIFGTGMYLRDDDYEDFSTQAVYGIWDYSDDEDDLEYVGLLSGGSITSTHLLGSPALLPQAVEDVQIVGEKTVRTLTAGTPDWYTTTLDGDCGDHDQNLDDCDPNALGEYPDPVKHLGWYFNLPTPGERVISDILIRDGKVIVVSYVAGGALCSTGGKSWLMSLDACTGSRVSEPNFDINGDGTIDENDLVDIDPGAGVIMAAPTGLMYDGQLQTPAFLIMPGGIEKMYMSSSKAKIEEQLQKGPKLGLTHWRLVRQ